MIDLCSSSPKLALALAVAAGLTACARSAPSPQAPAGAAAEAAPAAAEPTSRGVFATPADEDLSQQGAALEAAEADLDQALGRTAQLQAKKKGEADSSLGAGVSGAPGRGAPSKAPAARPAAPPMEREEAEPPRREDACSTACTALASMGRAAEHLCGLAGEGDQRCGDARARVRSAEARVRSSCPACAER